MSECDVDKFEFSIGYRARLIESNNVKIAYLLENARVADENTVA